MGSFDGAETSDLCGLYLLSKIQQVFPGPCLYRDDGLGASEFSARVNNMKVTQLCKVFKKYDLTILVEVNHKIVNFLDITLDLNTGLYKPYMKPNNKILYVHKESNHPRAVTDNLPMNINNRLSRLSANEEIFNEAAPPYQQALIDSEYEHILKFQPNIRSNNRKKKQEQKMLVV